MRTTEAPDEIAVGRTCRATFAVDASVVDQFAQLSGDRNPIHVDAAEARQFGFAKPVAHGALLMTWLSKMIGMDVPGPGALWLDQSVEWVRPVFVGDVIELTLTVDQVSPATGVLRLSTRATNQEGKIVMQGAARVKRSEKLAPSRAARAGSLVALVTGGSRGIGAAIARRLAADGMTVAVAYRASAQQAHALVEEIQGRGGTAKAFAADLADPRSAGDLARDVIKTCGRLDVLVHGATPPLQAVKLPDLAYRHLEPYLSTYVGGALALMAEAVPGMIERRFGRFIVLGTAAMLGVPPPHWAAYLVAKHALWGLVRSMAAELGPSGITSNMVSPGMTATDLTATIPLRAKEVEALRNPMRRLATPDDTAELVAFLASPAAGYLNGANLPLTGGA